MTHRPTVAVIGAGFSGLLTALHLANAPDGPAVRLIERSGAFGRGAAYATANPEHLLNVRVANMSAFPDQPDHFTSWLSGRDGWSAHGGFVTRGVYGDYLQDLLRQAMETGAAGRLLLEADEAVDMRRAGAGFRVQLALGREIEADAVVLALGVLRPAPPKSTSQALLESPRYLADPWTPSRPLDEDARDVLLLGAGLTMIDAVITLARPGRRFWAISRRGLLPRTHAPVPPRLHPVQPQGSPAALLRQVRAAADAAGDWREAVDDLRPHIQSIWRAWSPRDRQAFLRHLRPWWDVHRHRLSPGVARRIDLMIRARELGILAGEIQRISVKPDGLEVAWRPRGQVNGRRLHADAVINCTGMLGDIERSGEPLLRRLIAKGLVRRDPCRLGADVDADARLIGRDGAAHGRLYAVGPLTRSAFWEITSVPDLRTQAAQVAAAIGATLRTAAAA